MPASRTAKGISRRPTPSIPHHFVERADFSHERTHYQGRALSTPPAARRRTPTTAQPDQAAGQEKPPLKTAVFRRAGATHRRLSTGGRTSRTPHRASGPSRTQSRGCDHSDSEGTAASPHAGYRHLALDREYVAGGGGRTQACGVFATVLRGAVPAAAPGRLCGTRSGEGCAPQRTSA